MANHFAVECPGCGRKMKASPDLVGLQTKCDCGITFKIEPPKSQQTKLPLSDGRALKSTFGKSVILEGGCPYCGEVLKLKEADALKGEDTCPSCNTPFMVGEQNIALVKGLKQEIAAGASSKQEIRLRKKGQKQAPTFDAGDQVDSEDVPAGETDSGTLNFSKSEKKSTSTSSVKKRSKKTGGRRSPGMSYSQLCREAQTEGTQTTEELFPFVPRALSLLEVFIKIIAALGILALVVVAGVSIYLLVTGDVQNFLAGVLIVLVYGLLLALYYIFCMAGIELYKMLVSIESQSRRTNALLAFMSEKLEASD